MSYKCPDREHSIGTPQLGSPVMRAARKITIHMTVNWEKINNIVKPVKLWSKPTQEPYQEQQICNSLTRSMSCGSNLSDEIPL